ncbi:DUF1877 family protein [Nocardia sp. NPDC049149]|uniref:DUF1877 family protein n=1 Tax=Nocardia sp. NPDC049149 TaxID=3364315 RepID=UPI0037184519
MSKYVLFKRVTDVELEQAEEDSDLAHELIERDSSDDAEHTLWAFAGLQFLLDAEGMGIVVGWPDTPDELQIVLLADGETIFGLDSNTVARIATDLGATPFRRLGAHFDRAAMAADDVNPSDWSGWDTEEALNFLNEAYDDLVKFMMSTAGASSALLMEMP